LADFAEGACFPRDVVDDTSTTNNRSVVYNEAIRAEAVMKVMCVNKYEE